MIVYHQDKDGQISNAVSAPVTVASLGVSNGLPQQPLRYPLCFNGGMFVRRWGAKLFESDEEGDSGR